MCVWLVNEKALQKCGAFLKPIIMRRKIKSGIIYSTILKPGERAIDKRYKDGVDTGRFSSNKVPLPLKPMNPISKKIAEMLDSIPDWVNDIPKQVIRQQEASRHFKNKNKK
jgi:hypothetical protein